MNPKYPVYVVSKGRWTKCLTSRYLSEMKVPHYIVVEQLEFGDYVNAVNRTYATVLELPQTYLDDYDTCDDLGDSRSRGPGAARNFCIDHSSKSKRHWVMDDNLQGFYRLNRNEKVQVKSGTILRVAEDFVDRYTNVPVAGLNYCKFCKSTQQLPPFVKNTRIYSCLLIENSSGYRWRGRYNEDTDLSLRVLKDGLCTIQFNAFLCEKVTTQRMEGGNTKEFYADEGTKPKSDMLEQLHPDVAKVVWKFNRWHHEVDYIPFKEIELLRDESLTIAAGIDEYGMKLIPEKDYIKNS